MTIFLHRIFEIEESNFASLNRELTDDISGTEAEPILVCVIPRKHVKGAVFVIKIGSLYFEMYRERKA